PATGGVAAGDGDETQQDSEHVLQVGVGTQFRGDLVGVAGQCSIYATECSVVGFGGGSAVPGTDVEFLEEIGEQGQSIAAAGVGDDAFDQSALEAKAGRLGRAFDDLHEILTAQRAQSQRIGEQFGGPAVEEVSEELHTESGHHPQVAITVQGITQGSEKEGTVVLTAESDQFLQLVDDQDGTVGASALTAALAQRSEEFAAATPDTTGVDIGLCMVGGGGQDFGQGTHRVDPGHHDGQHVPALTSQPGQDSSLDEGGLTAAGGADDSQETFVRIGAGTAEATHGLGGLGRSSEENSCLVLTEGGQAGKRRASGRPGELGRGGVFQSVGHEVADEQNHEDEDQTRHSCLLQQPEGEGCLLSVGGEVGDHSQQTGGQHEEKLQYQGKSLAPPHIVSEGSR